MLSWNPQITKVKERINWVIHFFVPSQTDLLVFNPLCIQDIRGFFKFNRYSIKHLPIDKINCKDYIYSMITVMVFVTFK